MDALKEWATVVKALEQGEQTVLLRKGGILETASGFKLESKKFLLFPTFEHQKSDYIKPQFHSYLDEVKKNIPPDGYNIVTSYAEVLEDADVATEKKIKELSSFHIWSDSYITERRNWMPEKPMKALFLKVFKIPDLKIPIKSEYHGCKSWLDINEDIPSGKPVLDNTEIDASLEKFKEVTS